MNISRFLLRSRSVQPPAADSQPDMLSVTSNALTYRTRLWEHLARPGAFIRVVDGEHGRVLAFITRPDEPPPGYLALGPDDEDVLREQVRQAKHARALRAVEARQARKDVAASA